MFKHAVLCVHIGLYTGLTPLYLTEIATADIRGALGTLHQFGVTIGIFLSQILGFPEIFGNGEYWHILLGENFVALFYCISFILF